MMPTMYSEDFIIYAETGNCEICGRDTAETSPCMMCQVWVQNYSDALMLQSQ
jgi:hypothetical protein